MSTLKSLNNKNGNLRGVSSHYKFDYDDTQWKTTEVQGWVIYEDKDKYGFVLDLWTDDVNVEVTLSEAALERLLEAVQAKRLQKAWQTGLEPEV